MGRSLCGVRPLLVSDNFDFPFSFFFLFFFLFFLPSSSSVQSNPVILHRDLKSDNLLVTQDWVVKVADFGLTRFMSEKKQMTQVGTVREKKKVTTSTIELPRAWIDVHACCDRCGAFLMSGGEHERAGSGSPLTAISL